MRCIFVITTNDIEIFIMTHNRANLIEQSIESVFSQTVCVKRITVLDNESTDMTETLLKRYGKKINYIKTYGKLGNFYKAQEVASKQYCILFHDDDLIHPKYLENALHVLNIIPNIAQVLTRYTEFCDNMVPPFSDKISCDYYLFPNQKAFATHMFFIERIAYCTAIYRTYDFKNTVIDYDLYNKFNDWPFLLKISTKGKTVLFNDPNFLLLRRHKGQDTWSSTNSPTVEQIVNWDLAFWNIFKKDLFLRKMYSYRSQYYLRGKYDNFLLPALKKEYSFDSVLHVAIQKGIVISCKKEDKVFHLFQRFVLSRYHKVPSNTTI